MKSLDEAIGETQVGRGADESARETLRRIEACWQKVADARSVLDAATNGLRDAVVLREHKVAREAVDRFAMFLSDILNNANAGLASRYTKALSDAENLQKSRDAQEEGA